MNHSSTSSFHNIYWASKQYWKNKIILFIWRTLISDFPFQLHSNIFFVLSVGVDVAKFWKSIGIQFLNSFVKVVNHDIATHTSLWRKFFFKIAFQHALLGCHCRGRLGRWRNSTPFWQYIVIGGFRTPSLRLRTMKLEESTGERGFNHPCSCKPCSSTQPNFWKNFCHTPVMGTTG